MTTRLEQARAAVPAIACKGMCQAACGPVAWSQTEAEGWSNQGISPPTCDKDLTCAHLKAGRCAIYEHRPMVCRLFGAVRKLDCPHGCKPDSGYMSDDRASELLTSLGAIAGCSV